MVRGVVLLKFVAQKRLRLEIYKICRYFGEYSVPETFNRHFRPSETVDPQTIIYRQLFKFVTLFSPFWYAQQRTYSCLLRCRFNIAGKSKTLFAGIFFESSHVRMSISSGKSNFCGKIEFLEVNSSAYLLDEMAMFSESTLYIFFFGSRSHKIWVEVFWVFFRQLDEKFRCSEVPVFWSARILFCF